MKEFVVMMGRNKAKQAGTPVKVSANTLPERKVTSKDRSPQGVPPASPTSSDHGNLVMRDTAILDYKFLAIEVAKFISPDIH
ncbi:hypothetical protein GDO78_018571 [Eleutherodactylus coqui]|uniref:Uncharacterized protein n=1 Tax=Eleutherodactylus coqui TaxID=57060 RepID=A0A8J6B5B0_ELECQ|nr:hypothetical protein GDO78_018571 [Eleutherodactylus coqui]